MKRFNTVAAFALFVLVCVCVCLLAYFVSLYAGDGWRDYALYALAVATAFYLAWETRNAIHYFRLRKTNGVRSKLSGLNALVLLNDNGEGVKVWDIRGKTGLVIGRGRGDGYVDVDLSETEFAAAISDCHAVMNYTAEGWRLADAGSANGTSLMRGGQALALAPNEPVPLAAGDRICIAGETVLAAE